MTTSAAVDRAEGARLLLVGAVAVHLAVLYLPDPPAVGGLGALPFADALTHVAAFALVAWTGRLAGVPVAVLAALLLTHAVASEWVQHAVVPGRTGDPADTAADVVGIGVGLLLPLPRRRRS